MHIYIYIYPAGVAPPHWLLSLSLQQDFCLVLHTEPPGYGASLTVLVIRITAGVGIACVHESGRSSITDTGHSGRATGRRGAGRLQGWMAGFGRWHLVDG